MGAVEIGEQITNNRAQCCQVWPAGRADNLRISLRRVLGQGGFTIHVRKVTQFLLVILDNRESKEP